MEFNSLADFDACAAKEGEDPTRCLAPLRKFVETHPEHALAAAKKVGSAFMSWAALEFFDLALAHDKGDAICSDPDFHDALISALQRKPTSAEYALGKQLALTRCKGAAVSAFEKELSDTHPESFAEVACAVLKEAGRTHPACNTQESPAAVENSANNAIPQLDKNDLRLNPDVKVYLGPEAAKVSVAQVDGQNDLYLVLFEGINGPWNGKSVLHRENVRGPGHTELWTLNAGKKWFTLVKRTGYNGPTVVVGAPGNAETDFSYSADESEKATASMLIQAY